MAISTQELRSLVEPARVHRRVYTDPAVFDIEIERLFGAAWNYVGHISQVPAQGDYLCGTVARQPVVMVRHAGNDIRVLHNRCAHRGAQVVPDGAGNAELFRCCYHGWTYRTDGTLHHIPRPEGYRGTTVQARDAGLAMKPLRSANYRGFVFANLAADGSDLEVFLGDGRRALDNMVDRSPGGELRIAGGCFRTLHRNNWKIYLENLHDGLHPGVVHQSSIAASRAAAKASSGDEIPLPIRLVMANAQSYEQMAQLEVACYPNDHSDMRGFRDPRSDDAVSTEYASALVEARGEAESEAILAQNLHNACFYPNLSVHPGFMQLRVLHPVAVDRTQVDIWRFELTGAPAAFNRRTIIYANTVHSPSSLIKPDDLEAYHRVQLGLESQGEEWVTHERGLDADQPDTAVGPATSEHYIRNQYRAWLGYMTAAA